MIHDDLCFHYSYPQSNVQFSKLTTFHSLPIQSAMLNQTSANEKQRFIMTLCLQQYITDYTVANAHVIQSDIALHMYVH